MNIFRIVALPFQCIRVLYTRMNEDRVLETSSSLTFKTVLALVPLLAVLLAIAKGFSLDTSLETLLLREFGEHREVIEHLLAFSKTTLEQMKGGVIAGIGILLLLLTTTNLLSTTEDTMNRMWGVLQGRSLARRIADFQCCLLLFPLLLVIGSSMTLFIQTKLSDWSSGFYGVEPLLLNTIQLLPLVSLWVLFTLSYWLIPYVPVQKRYALITAACVTGVFYLLQTWYIQLQLTLTKISVIYGSFVALPLFFVWLYLSWVIFLLGSELLVFLQEKGWKRALLKWDDSESTALFATCALFKEVVRCFENGDIYSAAYYTKTLEIPMRARARIVRFLAEKQLIHVFSEGRSQLFLVPSQKGLQSGIGDLVLPSTKNMSEELRQRMEQWKAHLNEMDRSQ